ncbi:hypothetical protein CDV31_014540 [Fusarium ambrosium]|uniref:Heterokaryon incompatibility domain-containing protein n=1 Tax=Fusarium ambrosium TaxID=131363 RepID=A0A428SVL7_9HYPO|nr:hypothetical protein CDV31_014540 [Fusarium ambrosium]
MSDQSRDPGPEMASPTAAQLYDYLPLPHGSQFIRVLDIPENCSETDAGLTGSLRIVDLKDSPRFTALSYVWGKASGKSINCNGCDIKITDSCFEALSSLRAVLGSFTIWVDAVCINQRDNDEKSAQIPLMEEIYTWAEAVYIWLGPGTERTKTALDYVRVASRHRLLTMSIPWRNGSRPITLLQERMRTLKGIFTLSYYIVSHPFLVIFRNTCSIFRETDLLPELSCDQASFLELVDRPWLKRSWTFQEISLASNPILVFGQEHVPWLQWYEALIWVSDLEAIYTGNPGQVPGDPAFPYNKQNDVVDGETASWEPFKHWMSLCKVWQNLPRPCYWNENRFRKVLDDVGAIRDHCSVEEYSRALDAHWAICFMIFPSSILVTYILFLYCPPDFITDVVVPLFIGPVVGGTVSAILLLFFWCASVAYYDCLSPGYGLIYATRRMGSEQRNHLVGLVRAIRERECTQKKDRVFAVWGILQRLGIPQLAPNYRKSTGQVYRDAFAGLVEWRPSFINLLLDTGSRLPDAPSWVPDWSTITERSWLSSSYVYDPIQFPRRFEKSLSISISGDTLSVQAALLRTAMYCTVSFHKIQLDSAGDAMPGMQESLLHNTQILCQWVMRVRRDILVDSTYDSMALGILSTLNGCPTAPSNMDSGGRQVFNKVYTTMMRYSGQLRKELETMTGIVPATRTTLEDMAAEKECLDFLIKAFNKLAGKRNLFLCSNGLIGSGPDSMHEYDSISLINGVAAPMILRRQGDGSLGDVYTVLGPSFIEGLMGLDEENLELCWKQVDLV